MKRTHLPLNALRVFDAAARHLSFTRAAASNTRKALSGRCVRFMAPVHLLPARALGKRGALNQDR